MEPITLILAALAAGAAAGTQNVASTALADAYNHLKGKLSRTLTQEQTNALEGYERSPEEWRPQLQEHLAQSVAIEDHRTLELAQRVLALSGEQSVAKYLIDSREAKGVMNGDGNIQHNTFSD